MKNTKDISMTREEIRTILPYLEYFAEGGYRIYVSKSDAQVIMKANFLNIHVIEDNDSARPFLVIKTKDFTNDELQVYYEYI